MNVQGGYWSFFTSPTQIVARFPGSHHHLWHQETSGVGLRSERNHLETAKHLWGVTTLPCFQVCSSNNGKVGNRVPCPHSRCFGSYFDIIFLMYFISSQPHPHQSSLSTQFSQEWVVSVQKACRKTFNKSKAKHWWSVSGIVLTVTCGYDATPLTLPAILVIKSPTDD